MASYDCLVSRQTPTHSWKGSCRADIETRGRQSETAPGKTPEAARLRAGGDLPGGCFTSTPSCGKLVKLRNVTHYGKTTWSGRYWTRTNDLHDVNVAL